MIDDTNESRLRLDALEDGSERGAPAMKPSESIAKSIPVGLAVAVAMALCLFGQTNTTVSNPLRFEVASIRATTAGCPPACGLIRSTPGSAGYHADGATLRSLMTVAYGVTDRQISDSPRWMDKERFDIEAKADRPHNIDELHTMLSHLLEERFHLELRRETRQESVWNLIMAKGGSKMPTHDPNDKDYQPIQMGWASDKDGSVCASVRGPNETMAYLAFSLSRTMRITVIDQTGLSGRYDVNLRYMPEGVNPRHADGTPVPFSSDCSDLFAALPRQLGLQLVSAKGPVEYLVVEHVEQPTEN